jgi:ABC-type glycerol-3-phosphate transport system substrate-binding protein
MWLNPDTGTASPKSSVRLWPFNIGLKDNDNVQFIASTETFQFKRRGYKMKKQFLKWTGIALTMLVFSGCTFGKTADTGEKTKNALVNSPVKEPNPITLKVYPIQPITEEEFKLLIADPVSKKYPYITMELLSQSKSVEEFVASRQPVDLFTQWNGTIKVYEPLDIWVDITPFIKKNMFNLDRFDQGALETIRSASSKGQLYGLPYNIQLNALYYNKDIFDKFGVTYPKDGMSWDDAVELARKVTRLDGGTQYSGLGMDGITRLTYPLSLNPIDAKTNQAMLDNDLYRKSFLMAKQIYSIPGNEPIFSSTPFIKERRQAMFASVNMFDQLSKQSDMNWDVAQFPSYKETPNIYGMYDLHVLMMSNTSKYKDELMKVYEVFFSDEVQKISTRKTGRVSALTNPELKLEFGADNPALKGKKLQSIFKSKPAPSPIFTEYQSKGTSVMKEQSLLYLQDQKDLNTMIRDANEAINTYIKAQKASK